MDERQAFHQRHLTLLSRLVAGALPCNRWKLNSYIQAEQQADDTTQWCKGRKGEKKKTPRKICSVTHGAEQLAGLEGQEVVCSGYWGDSEATCLFMPSLVNHTS